MACHFYFVSPSKVSNNTARIRASKKRILFKRRHLSSPVYFRKRSLLLHILRSVIKIAIGLRKGLTDRRKWQRQCREIVLHLSEHASTLITLLSAVGAIKSQTICIPGVAGYLHGNKSPWRYCRSSLSSYCCLFGVTCCTVFPSHGSFIHLPHFRDLLPKTHPAWHLFPCFLIHGGKKLPGAASVLL